MSIIRSIKEAFTPSFWTDSAFVQKGIIEPAKHRSGEEWFFSPVPGQFFTYEGHSSSLKVYEKCPPVTAIINRKAQAYINGKTWIMNTQGKESTTPDAKKLRKLFARPNALQSWKQFEAQQYIYQQLFGYAIVLPIKPFGFKDNIDATSLWNIPPYMVEIKETNKLYYQSDTKGIIDKVILTYKNQKTELNVEDIFIVKDFTPSFNSLILPESRIKAIELPINNIIGAYESRNVLIKSRGPMYVISSNKGDESGKIPLLPKEKEEVLKDFRAKYGISKEQSMAIITSASINLQTVGFSTRDLLLIEEVVESAKSICDALNYPPHLLGLIDPTFNNQNAAEKGLYQNSIIPDADSVYEQWNQFFFGAEESNIRIEKDYNHLQVLQEDDLAKANARLARNNALSIEFKFNLITLNRWLELNGEDTRPDGNKYYSDIKDLINVPQISNNGQGPQTGEAK